MAPNLEPTLNKAPSVSYSYTNINPPSQLYIGRDDSLLVTAYGSIAGLRGQITARLLTPDGEIRPNQYDFPFSADRSNSAQTFHLAEGFLLSLIVGPSAGTGGRRGQAFVQVWLIRGDVYTGLVGQVLISGYVTSNIMLTWPGIPVDFPYAGRGNIRTIVGTDPAAGVEISETVPTNALWRLVGFNYTLVTSAVAATRISQLLIDDGVNAGVRGIPGATQAASLTNSYEYGAYGALPAITGTLILGDLPPDIFITGGGRIRTLTTALDPGDNYGPPTYNVEEWLFL